MRKLWVAVAALALLLTAVPPVALAGTSNCELVTGNLVTTNCGFETSTLDEQQRIHWPGWADSSATYWDFMSAGSAYSGDNGLQAGPSGHTNWVEQDVATTADAAYVLRFYLLGGGDYAATFSASVDGTSIYARGSGDVLSGWMLVEAAFTAADASTTLRFTFQNDPAYWFLDDVSVLPEGVTPGDTTPPTVTLAQDESQSDPTTSDLVQFVLVATEGLDTSTVGSADDFIVTNGTIGTINCSGSPTTCTILVTASAIGDVTIAPTTGFSVADLAGNAQTSVGGTDRSVTYVGLPANDNLADARAIAGSSGSVSGSTFGASIEPSESSWWAGSTNSVWYAWTAKGKNVVATFTAGDCDTSLHVSSPAPAGPPDWYPTNVIASSYPDGCVDHATMTFLATGGQTYWIRVSEDQSTGTPESFTLAWTTKSAARGSLSISLTPTRGDPTSCTMTAKGVNLLADQVVTVRSTDDATETTMDTVEFSTGSGRWSSEPMPVAASLWSVESGYTIWTTRHSFQLSDGVSWISPSFVNRCHS